MEQEDNNLEIPNGYAEPMNNQTELIFKWQLRTKEILKGFQKRWDKILTPYAMNLIQSDMEDFINKNTIQTKLDEETIEELVKNLARDLYLSLLLEGPKKTGISNQVLLTKIVRKIAFTIKITMLRADKGFTMETSRKMIRVSEHLQKQEQQQGGFSFGFNKRKQQ